MKSGWRLQHHTPCSWRNTTIRLRASPHPETFKAKRTAELCSAFLLGGATGDRTPDLMHAKHVLSQLSYRPRKRKYTLRVPSGKVSIMRVSLSFLLLVLACTEDTRRPPDASFADSAMDVVDEEDAGSNDSDNDMDGVTGLSDLCPETAGGDPVDVNGCSTRDDDQDGVLNDMDRCDETPVGANVDGIGCRLENEGTLDGRWLINGTDANSGICDAANLAQVRLVIDRVGRNFLMRDFPCAQGSFDGREDDSAPRVPRNENFTTYWQAIDATGVVVSESATLPLALSGDAMHATLVTPDFVF